jgi:hypothetical protein
VQHSLFKPPALEVTPVSTLTEPRLWIRRLVIWSEPWTMLRSIELRPGLNIIWSPDPADRGAQANEPLSSGTGHGAGKTLVCRLLRYCLGEPHCAPDLQRVKIASAFRNGRVGAELLLDGVAWAVVRSIGVQPFDVVREGATLEAIIADEAATTGMSPLIDAIAQRILSSEVAEMINTNVDRAWLATVEWLARDQECRFGEVTEWRNASSGSGSPQLSVGRAINVIRALIGAITPRENSLEQEAKTLDKKCELASREMERQHWGISQAVSRIAKSLELEVGSLPDDGLIIGRLRTAASEKLARISVVTSDGELATLEGLESQHEDARQQVRRLEGEFANIDAKRATAEALANMVASETPGISAGLDEAEMPPCPICDVPIDRALADGCRLSHKLPDLPTLRQRREKNEKDLRTYRGDVEEAKKVLSRLGPDLDAARANVAALWKEVVAARRLRKERTDAWYAARRVGDDITDLDDLLASKLRAAEDLMKLKLSLEQARNAAAAERDQHGQVFSRLGRHFDALVRKLLRADASGRVYHDGNGLHLTVEYGGERSTPAIDSVKVLAFDLAAMCRSIEGATYMPALLIHDSPREADLGLSIYHELFRLVVELERMSATPLFQYIVTTTTRPPDELSAEPWLRLELNGAPAQNRLLMCDL